MKTLTPKQKQKQLVAKAVERIGGLSEPSKMPCFSFSIPAWHCRTGKKLRKVANSICSKCYALKGNYHRPNVKNAMERRFRRLKSKTWVQDMVTAIGGLETSGFFRFHDSGDIQSVAHLERIVSIAKLLPGIRFWLPTREYSFVSAYVEKHGPVPENLTIRLSALAIDSPPPIAIAKRLGLVTSGVSKADTFNCPSSKQQGKCLDCRACWNRDIPNVNYKLH